MEKREAKPFIAEKAGESQAYMNRSDLTKVIIPSGVTEIGFGAFRDCEGLTSVVIPDSMTKIGVDAFPPGICIQRKKANGKD